MSYYVCTDDSVRNFKNIFEAVSVYRDLKIESNSDTCTIGIELENFKRDIFYKQNCRDFTIDVLTIGAQTLFNIGYKYVEDEIKMEVEALVEVMVSKPF